MIGEEELVVRHAEHFLTRLDRLNTAEVDLALGLYRDPELLREVLQRVSLPDGAERVAISLGDPVRGPFIVVTRDGHFVTCLAEGMRVVALPVVSRAQLDVHARRIATLRERMADAQRLTSGSKRPCGELLRRLVVKADAVSREEFLAISAWEPLLAPALMHLYLGMSRELPLMADQLRRSKRKSRRVDEALHQYWNIVHATGHLALLATMGGEGEHYRALAEHRPEGRAAFSYPLTHMGVSRFIVIGAWAVGRLGKQLLPAYKQALGDDGAFFSLMDSLFGMVAIARRSSRLRAEIAKALSAASGAARTPQAATLRAAMGEEVKSACGLARYALDVHEQEVQDWIFSNTAEALGAKDQPLPDVLHEPVRTAMFSQYFDGVTNGDAAIR